jgi:ankyrin repeat protein
MYHSMKLLNFSGHGEVVRLLLTKSDIDINKATTTGGWTALYAACQNGHVEIVRRLLQQPTIDIGIMADIIWTQEFHAERKGHVEISFNNIILQNNLNMHNNIQLRILKRKY